MTKSDDYFKKVEQVLKDTVGLKGNLKKGLRLDQTVDTVPAATQLLSSVRLAQKQIRQVKREVNADMKAIRQTYKEKASRVQPSTGSMLLSGISLGLGKGRRKGAQRSSVADQKRKLNEERDKVLQPYESLKHTIDDILLQLDQTKLNVEKWMAENK